MTLKRQKLPLRLDSRLIALSWIKAKPFRTLHVTISPAGPAYVFKLFSMPGESGLDYRLVAGPEDESEPAQVECFHNGVSLEWEKLALQAVDVNNDGIKEIRILGGFTQGGNIPWFRTWVFNPRTRRFAWSKNPSLRKKREESF